MLRSQTKIFPFNKLHANRPSLCAYCGLGAGPLLKLDAEKETAYTFCTNKHMHAFERGERKLTAITLNKTAVTHSLTKSKERILEVAKNNKSYSLSDWSKEDWEDVAASICLHYIKYVTLHAQNGSIEDLSESLDGLQ